jgi:Amt family ammonium transporter
LSATRETDLFLDVGMIDFAGSTVVHLTGGMTALIATIVLGPRTGRFYDLRGNPLKVPKEFAGHSLALQMLGVFILWFGWYGFNAGSILNITNDLNHTIVSHTAINTTLAASAGSIMTLFLSTVVAERFTGEIVFSLSYAMNGCLSGLVAITAGCSVVEHWAAIIIGLVGGALYLACSKFLVKKRIDDAVDGIPVHLINGIWGTLSVGLFAVPELLEQVYGRGDHAGWFYSWGQGSADAKLLGAQVVGILFVSGWVMITMFPFFCFLHYVGWLRADSLEEVVGLDAAYSQGVLQTRARAQSEEENMEHYISEYVKQREEKAFIKKINSNSTHGRTILGASMHSMNIINSSMHSRKDSLPRAIESLNNSRHSGSRGSRSINDIAIDNSHGQSEDGLAAPDEGSA